MKKVYLKGMSAEEIIRLLKEGKEIKYENTNLKTKMIEGVICDFEEDKFTIGSCLQSNQNVFSYFEEEEKFEITETGIYKTRDGRKAFVHCIDNENEFFSVDYAIENDNVYHTATKYGFNGPNNKERDIDIVAKWED